MYYTLSISCNMLEILKRIRDSKAYYKKQNKRLLKEDRLRKLSGKNEIHKRDILENEKRIEKLKEYHEHVTLQMKQQENVKRNLR